MLLWGGFVFFDVLVSRSTRMSAPEFDTDVLLFSWVTSTTRYGFVVAGVLGVILFLPRVRIRWQDLETPPQLRWATIAFAATICWPFLTLSHNYYFGQGYLWDRFLLLALLFLTWFRPAAIFGVTTLCYLLMWQYSWPALGGPVFAHKQMSLEILTALMAWLTLRALRVQLRAVDLIMLWGILIAARYWSAGYAKLAMNWWEYTNVHHALIAAYAHGWLGWAQQSFVTGLAELIAKTEPWVQYAVMGFELSAIAMFLHKRVAVLVLLLAISFHFAVILLYGYIFWTWIVVDLIFIALLIRWPVDPFSAMSVAPRVALSSVLIAFSPSWTDATLLGWFDSSVSYSYRYTVHDKEGRQYSVSPRFFAPYDDRMTMSAFRNLSKDHAILTGPYGIVRSAELAKQLDDLETPEHLLTLQSEKPANFNEASSRRLENFLKRVFAVRNSEGPRYEWIRWLAPPAQFQSFLRADAHPPYDGSGTITRVTVGLVTSWYKDQTIHEVSRETVLDVAIPDDVPPIALKRASK